MIASSVSSDRSRRASGAPRIVPTTGRSSFGGRQVEAIYNENDDEECAARAPSPPQEKVMRSTRRRRSSINRTRESIMRILRDQKATDTRSTTFADTLLNPVDLLVNPERTLTSVDIQEQWQQKQLAGNTTRRTPWYIFLPHAKFRLTWDAMMASLLSLMAFYIPFRVCFYWEEAVEPRSIFIFESTIDCVFALDIVLNFLTAYTDRTTDVIVTSPKLIAMRYLRGFFLIDLLATIPFGYILTQSPIAIANKLGKLGRLPKLVRFARAARLLKLLRVYKLHEFIMRLEIEYNVHHGISRLIKIVVMILLVTHLVGCCKSRVQFFLSLYSLVSILTSLLHLYQNFHQSGS